MSDFSIFFDNPRNLFCFSDEDIYEARVAAAVPPLTPSCYAQSLLSNSLFSLSFLDRIFQPNRKLMSHFIGPVMFVLSNILPPIHFTACHKLKRKCYR